MIGDSYGTPRKEPSDIVLEKETWPQLVADEISEKEIQYSIDFKTFRCFVDCVDIIKNKGERANVIIIGAGIVDIFPRTLPYRISRSQNIFLKALRFFVRRIRKFWMQYIYCETWFTIKDIEKSINEVKEYCDNLIILSTPPLSVKHALDNPQGQPKIDELNDFMRTISDYGNNGIHVVDIDKIFRESGQEELVDSLDSHFTKSGNSIAAKNIVDKLNELM